MTSSNDTNETIMNETTLNLIKALEEYKPLEAKPEVIKLIYDPKTLMVTTFTFDETDQPWVQITREQYNAGLQFKRLKIVDGKIVEIKPESIKKKL